MKYFVNPAKRTAAPRRKVGKKKRTTKQLANDRRLGRMAKARAKAKKRTPKRASSKGTTMAARKRKTAKRRPAAKRRVTRKRSPVVKTLKRGAYAINPRKRRRSAKRYSRNPGLMASAQQAAMDAIMVGVGGAASKTISNLIPIGGSPLVDLAKGLVVAIGLRKVGTKFLGADKARFIAAGALLSPLRDAIVGYVPGAAAFLGEEMSAYSSMAAYADGSVAGYIDGTGSFAAGEELGSYSGGMSGY